MGPLPTAMHRFPRSSLRPWRRRGLLFALLGCLGLSGCGSREELPSVLYQAIGTNSDQAIDADLLEETQSRMTLLERAYRQMHPAVRFQFGLYQEDRISDAITRRNRAGLGPDLIFVNGDTAERMMAAGLVDPFPATAAQLKTFDPDDLDRLRNNRGELAGLPVLIHTQVACFNRKRLPEAPRTVTELLAASAAGHPIGLTVDLYNLFWTAGSLGAMEGINQAVTGRPPSPANVQRMEGWLAWLQNASNQQRVTFFGDQKSALSEFMAGRLDWVACNSISLPRLRRKLGASLGVSTLPSGPDGSAPSPLKRLRVLALGASSSTAGRARAISFARFATNPLTQRTLTIGSQTLLPANRFVKVPVSSSLVLDALNTSNQQGDQLNAIVKLMHDNDARLPKAQALITDLVFGEVSPRATARALIRLFGEQR